MEVSERDAVPASNFDTPKKKWWRLDPEDNSAEQPVHSDGMTEGVQLDHRTRQNHSRSEEALSRKSRVTSAQSGPRRSSCGASGVGGDGSHPEVDREGEGGTGTAVDAAHRPGGVCLGDLRSSQGAVVRSS